MKTHHIALIVKAPDGFTPARVEELVGKFLSIGASDAVESYALDRGNLEARDAVRLRIAVNTNPNELKGR
jgi:hypothetical protein